MALLAMPCCFVTKDHLYSDVNRHRQLRHNCHPFGALGCLLGALEAVTSVGFALQPLRLSDAKPPKPQTFKQYSSTKDIP